MRKLSALLLIVICLFAVTSCGSDSGVEVPDGMQLVAQSESEGFIFFGPAAWVIANRGDVYATYMTAVNNTSVTFTKIEMPEGDFTKESVEAYFNTSLSAFPYEITYRADMEAVNFGKPEAAADLAYKTVYTYTYGEFDVSVMQIAIKRGGDRFLFTYTSYGKVSDETSYYRVYLEKAQAVIDSFTFTEKGEGNANTAPEYPKDADGYILVSDEALAGFELYVPEGYTVTDSTAFVSVKASDNAVITLSKATETGVAILDYLAARHDDMAAITTDFTDIAVKVSTAVNTNTEYFKNWSITTLPEVDDSLRLGDLDPKNTVSYEYSYTYRGVRYHVYQVLGVDRYNGYVFTYTATEDEYATHLDEIKTILTKVKF